MSNTSHSINYGTASTTAGLAAVKHVLLAAKAARPAAAAVKARLWVECAAAAGCVRVGAFGLGLLLVGVGAPAAQPLRAIGARAGAAASGLEGGQRRHGEGAWAPASAAAAALAARVVSRGESPE